MHSRSLDHIRRFHIKRDYHGIDFVVLKQIEHFADRQGSWQLLP